MLIMMGGALVLMVRVLAVPPGPRRAAPGPASPRPCRSPPWWRRCSSGTTSSTHGPQVTIAGAIAFDGFDVFIQIAVAIAMLLTALVGDGYLRREGMEGPEFQVLAMMSASGAMMMGAANDLIVIFLGLEIMSIALYVLAAFNPKRAESGEAALKYFVLGAFSSAVFVYGIALVYGATGSTNLPQIADYLSKNVVVSNGVLLAGLALLAGRVRLQDRRRAVPHVVARRLPGLAVPGHRVHGRGGQGRRFAALLRVFVSSFGPSAPTGSRSSGGWPPLSLVLGAAVALVQQGRQADDGVLVDQPCRLHPARGGGGHRPGGVGLARTTSSPTCSWSSGRFAVITVMAGEGDTGHQTRDYRGLAKRQPLLALAFAVLLLGPGRRAVHHRVPGQVRGGGGVGGRPRLRVGRRWPWCRRRWPPSSTCGWR